MTNIEKVLMGIDVGFGETKIFSSKGEGAEYVYPSFVVETGSVVSKMLDLQQIDPNALRVRIDGQDYIIGENARDVPVYGQQKRTKARDRANDIYSQVLFKTAIALACPDEEGDYEAVVVTGLPNTETDTQIETDLANFLQEPFEVEFVLSKTHTLKKRVQVVEVPILNQPEGTVAYAGIQLTEDRGGVPLEGSSQYIGVVDIGYFTTDYSFFNKGIVVSPERTSSSTVGVSAVVDQLQHLLKGTFTTKGFTYDFSDSDVDQVLRTGELKFGGETYDFSDELDKICKRVAQTIAREVNNSWGTDASRVEKIILSGGGANLLGKFIEKAFSGQVLQKVEIVKDSEVANVRGFYIYGCLHLIHQSGTKKGIKEVYENYGQWIEKARLA